jgi:hypothetical protein
MFITSKFLKRPLLKRFSSLKWKDSNNFYSCIQSKYEKQPITFDNLKSRIDLLSTLETKETLPLQYHTEPKLSIIDAMAFRGMLVSTDKFRDTRGENSTLLLGAKGIGKSSTLFASCVALATMDENLICVYLQYNDVEQNIKPSIAIRENLKQRGIKVENLTNMEGISRAMIENDLHALIVVDELDQVYQNSDEGTSLGILNELSYMASIPCGSYCVVACGSSATLPLLITKGGVMIDFISKEYPLISKSPNLNGDKFPSYRLGVGLMSDSEIETIIKHIMQIDKVDKQEINFFRLFCGPNVRRISRITKSTMNMKKREIENQMAPYDIQDVRSMQCKEDLELLINKTYNRMISVNKHLFNNITKYNIIKNDWSTLNPLSRGDLEEIIKACNASNKNYTYNIRDYLRLVDTNWFISDEILSEVYPQTPYHLICHKLYPGHSKVREYTNTLIKNMESSLPSIFPYVAGALGL